MPTTLVIPDVLLNIIKAHAIPFVDHTALDVITRWAEHFEAQAKVGKDTSAISRRVEAEVKLNPSSPPDLTHTRARGTFGSTSFSNWNDLVRLAHMKAYAKVRTFEELRDATLTQLQKGKHSANGFHYVSEIGLSIQGVDANRAWEHTLRLAQFLKAPVRVAVEWRNNPNAARPGETATLEWRPA